MHKYFLNFLSTFQDLFLFSSIMRRNNIFLSLKAKFLPAIHSHSRVQKFQDDLLDE